MHSIASVKILLFFCTVCNFVVHERCLKLVVSACSSIATTLIKNPVAHCFSTPSIFKRKFCDVCRKRLEDSAAIRCERKSWLLSLTFWFFCIILCVNTVWELLIRGNRKQFLPLQSIESSVNTVDEIEARQFWSFVFSCSVWILCPCGLPRLCGQQL